MALRPAFDLDLLRTLIFIAEEASFTKAAERVGRTQSAVTLQVQKLEALVGQTLLVRSKGGPVELTPQGQLLVDRAREMLRLNDDTFRALSSSDVPATLRLGVPTWCAPFFLSQILNTLRNEFPNVLVEVVTGFSCQLVPRIKDNAFDLVVSEGSVVPRSWQSTEVWRGPLKWITSTTEAIHMRDPLPLCLYPSECPWRPAWLDDCPWRSAALRSLEREGRSHRVVAVADTIEGLYASVAAGAAVTVSIDGKLPDGLRLVRDDEGLPALPDTNLVMIKSRDAHQPLTDYIADLIESSFALA